jgi:hypothetical protein
MLKACQNRELCSENSQQQADDTRMPASDNEKNRVCSSLSGVSNTHGQYSRLRSLMPKSIRLSE